MPVAGSGPWGQGCPEAKAPKVQVLAVGGTETVAAGYWA